MSDVGYVKTGTGYAPVPSRDWADRGQDMIIPELSWAVRNQILPSLNPSFSNPPALSLKPNERWVYSPLRQEWQIVDKDSWDYWLLQNRWSRKDQSRVQPEVWSRKGRQY